MEYGKPRKCLEHKPTAQSVLFCDRFINLSTVSMYTGISTSHLSMLFSGKRQPSLRSARLIAKALKMAFHVFLSHLETHTGQVKPYLRNKPKKFKKTLDKVLAP